MKKPIIMITAALAILTMNAFAQDSSSIHSAVSEAFDATFPGATRVSWTALRNNVSKAQFAYDGHAWLAFFDGNAKVISSGRKVRHMESLPLQISRGIEQKKERMEKKYGGLTILHTFEMITDGETKYYSTLDNEKVCLLISTSPSGNAVLERKEFKEAAPQIRPAPANVIAKKATD